MSEQAVESCELGLSVCSAAHAAEVGDCEVRNDRVVPRVIVRLHFVCVCHNWNFAITVITTCRFLA